MSNKNKKSQVSKGFTLIELIIYMGLLSILLYILMQIFTSILETRLNTQLENTINSDAQYIINRLNHDISQAESITSPAEYGESQSTLHIVIDTLEYEYTLNNGALELSTPSGTDRLNSINTDIEDISFTKIGTNSHDTINITFQIKNAGENMLEQAKEFEITVAPR